MNIYKSTVKSPLIGVSISPLATFAKKSGLRYLSLLCLLVEVSCQAPEPPVAPLPPIEVDGTVRYLADEGQLDASINFADSLELMPRFLGQPMLNARGLVGPRFRSRQLMDFPGELGFSLFPTQKDSLSFFYDFVPPRIDALPELIDRSKPVNFPVADEGLRDRESLVLFLEPADGGAPKRLLIAGPTASGTVTLPTSAILDVKPGDYSAYIIKQQLFKRATDRLKISMQTEYFTPTKPLTVR